MPLDDGPLDDELPDDDPLVDEPPDDELPDDGPLDDELGRCEVGEEPLDSVFTGAVEVFEAFGWLTTDGRWPGLV